MSRLTVWGQRRSSNVQKVLWALDELGLDFERIDAGAEFGRIRDPAYLALNPNGLVPTLEDGDTVLWESNAIVRYLCAKYGRDPLYPRDLGRRARADGWCDWCTTTLWCQVRPLLIQLTRTPEAERNQKEIEGALSAANRALAILDGELANEPYVAGAHFSFGDIPLGIAAQRWFRLQVARDSAPHVDAWYASLARRPAFERWVNAAT